VSDTPKTDAAIFYIADKYGGNIQLAVPAEFAAGQERRITELDAAIQEIAELISGHDGHVFDDIAKVLLGTKP
jgi:hypothetical protein